MTRLMHRTDKERVRAPEGAIIDPTAVSRGVVTYHNLEKGYGKIHSDGVEYFFHITACRGRFHTLTEGTPVTFTWKMVDKGPRAFEVRQDYTPRAEDLESVDQRGNR